MNRFVSWCCKIFIKPLISRFLIKDIKGVENIPKGNFILAANHQSHLDQIATGYVCVPRRFHMVGQTDRYSGITKVFLYLIYFFGGVICLNRKDETSKKEVIEKSLKVLREGDILIIYPEGTRSRTGKLGKGKTGVAKIHLRTGVPILPVGIRGTFDLMPPGKGFFKIKKNIQINIGHPLCFKEEIDRVRRLKLDQDSEEYKKICREITDKVMQEIRKLSQDE